ncbi:RNA polymerase sigma-70 factor [Pontibacter sp. 13R65]|uniref:RNA polymerase sigma-70 factor n=1 Tax=Pontibacter sp. 13R65 TaxID=3127458 RepID=UPI00301C3173
MKSVISDDDLLQLIAQKNERAFTVLYNRYYTELCKAAFKKVPDEPVVEEIVQDVFVALWNNAERLDISNNIRSYLFATLRNKVLYEIRTRISKRALALNFEPVNEFSSSVDISEIIAANELEKRIHAVIDGLSPQSREAFRLSRFEQMSYQMIAEQLHVSVGTVEKHISKALAALRKELARTDSALLIALTLYLAIHRL